MEWESCDFLWINSSNWFQRICVLCTLSLIYTELLEDWAKMVPDNWTGKNLCVWLSQHTDDQTKQTWTSFRLLPDIFTAAVWGKDYFVDCEVWNVNRPKHSSVMFVLISRWAAEVPDLLLFDSGGHWNISMNDTKHTYTICVGLIYML